MVRAVLFKGAGCLTTRATSYLRKSKVFLCESKSLPISVPRVGSAVLICVYAIVLVSLSGARPLWLDEIWQLIGTRDLSGPPLMRYVATFPGAAPLGYLVQHWTINLFGFSLFFSKVPIRIVQRLLLYRPHSYLSAASHTESMVSSPLLDAAADPAALRS
jgi:hypothetical protein